MHTPINGNSPLVSDPSKKFAQSAPKRIVIQLVLVFAFFLALMIFSLVFSSDTETTCEDTQLTATLLESIPEEVVLETHGSTDTTEGWLRLINSANKTLDIACFYMSLSEGTNGKLVIEAMESALERGVVIRIAQNPPSKSMPDIDTSNLAKKGAHVVNSDFPTLTGGVLHTKFILADKRSFYIGSANLDWRSLEQVKELGVLVENSDKLGEDLAKVFESYWYIGVNHILPAGNAVEFYSPYNSKSPYHFNAPLNGSIGSKIHISSAPPQSIGSNRAHDIEAIIDIINNAEEHVYIEVMDYAPLDVYNKEGMKYWGEIDEALRIAAVDRKVKVKLLVAKWKHTKSNLIPFLKSLDLIPNIEVLFFKVPELSDGRVYPYTRVNHAKFMVSEKSGFISTSNWSKGYFYDTAGVSMIVEDFPNLQFKLMSIFVRDWNSEYVKSL
ncbi:hypothetical protein GEMRC1_008142 [Eukaryota sp. GEM-RC1]